MSSLTIIFWCCAALTFYTYAGYPFALALCNRVRKNPWRKGEFQGSVSIVLCVRNEEKNLDRRLKELTGLLDEARLRGEIIVASDGSTDKTVSIARTWERDARIRVLDRPESQGKSAALSEACGLAQGDVLVLCDARQRWAPDALVRLLENFADPRVGAVSGDLVIETSAGVMAGMGLYWRFEKWLRRNESRLNSQVSVTGAISAVRRKLFRPIPIGTLCDDVYWPLQVAMQGYRVVHDERAVAFDVLPENPRDEFRRKVRTLAGNWQLVTRLPASLLPWRNPVWLSWLSHKLLRQVMPIALVGLLWTAFALSGPFYRAALTAQIEAYGLALLGLWPALARRFRPAATAASFLILNAAAVFAFGLWVSGRAAQSWRRVSYHRPRSVPSVRVRA